MKRKYEIRERIVALGVAIGASVAVVGAASAPVETSRTRYLMGTTLEIRAAGTGQETALEAAFDRVAALEGVLSDWDPNAELARLNTLCATPDNAESWQPVSSELALRLAEARAWAERTDGAFDPTLGAIAVAEGLRPGLETTGPVVTVREHYAVRLAEPAVRCGRAGLRFDLGGIGKGMALDAAAEELRRRGVENVLLDFGGQVLALGDGPGDEGWTVGVAAPEARDRAALGVRLLNESLAVSGNGERGMHLYDPARGTPTKGGAQSGVIAPSATAADVFATVLAVTGDPANLPELVDYLVQHSDADRAPHMSPGFAARAGAPAASGDTPTKKEKLEEKVERLGKELEVVAGELAKLRAGEDVEAKPDAKGPQGMAPAASKVYRKDRGVSIGGYGEFLYEDFSATKDDGSRSGKGAKSDFLRAVFYFGYKFNDKILFNSEIEFEHASTGKSGSASVEFAYIDFMLDPRANVRAGLVLVPVGLVNELHEPPTFLGARRPDVEGKIIPTTWRENGVGLWGDIGPFSYRTYVMNGMDSTGFGGSSGLRGGRQKGSKAKTEDLAFVVRVDYTGVPGFLAGGSYYSGDSGHDAVIGGEVLEGNVSIVEMHFDWKWRGIEARGLWANVDVDQAELISIQNDTLVGSEMDGWYLQAGYNVFTGTRFANQALIPFVRVEEFDTHKEVPSILAKSGEPAYDREVMTYGLVYRPIPQVAVKVDFQDFDDAAGTGLDQVNAAVGFYF